MEEKNKKIVWEPTAIVNPVPPTLVTCGTVESPKVLTIAWTGILNTKPSMTYISVRPERYSYETIDKSGEFVINLATKDIVKAVDFCGVRSGSRVDKFKETGLTVQSAQKIKSPIIKQCPINIECKVKEKIELGSHHMFIAEVVCVNVDESLIDKDGKLHLDKSGILAYAHGEYFELGKKLGSFGYSVMKKKTINKRRYNKNTPK
ncbi:MAG: flavin reductase family protein [Oscillospiraceae bacterium]